MKMSILKYRIASSDIYGRYLVADKDIAAGEIIIREEPVIVGPMNIEKQIFCFACMRSIFNTTFVCSKCKVAPLCSELCEQWQVLHSGEECALFEQNQTLMSANLAQLMNILMHLRLWLIRKTNVKLWKEISLMEAHLKERKSKTVWDDVKSMIIKIFESLNIISPNDEESCEIIQQISGILDVNSFEIRSQTDFSELPLRGLYLESSLMAHKCISNTHLTVDDQYKLTVYASVPIKKDEIICFNYTSPFMGFAERQFFLQEGKYFQCSCLLCQDLTEGGTNMSTIFCPKCKKGYVTMQNVLEDIPYGRMTKWKCCKCDKCLSGCLVKTTLIIARNLINNSDPNDIEEMENLLKKLSVSLHTNHFIMLILKQKLLDAYKQEITNYVELRYLHRMIELGNELLNVVNTMEPGISRLKGILLYELHLPMVILANRQYTLQKITIDILLDKLEEARNFLKKSLTMLLLEPPTSSEGLLAKEALKKMKNLNQSIIDVKSLPRN